MQKFKDFIYYNRKELLIITIFLSLFGFYIYYDNNTDSDEIVLDDVISKDNNIEISDNKDEEKETIIMVDVKGEVNKPGAYTFSLGKRVIDAIEESGGLKEKADTSGINLSEKLFDEMVIIIPSKEVIDDNLNKKDDSSSNNVQSSIKQNKVVENNAEIKKQSDNKVSINTASLSELMTISGIGEKKAQSIIDYRKNSKFKTIEDIKNVSGIGEALFAKIKDYIKV